MRKGGFWPPLSAYLISIFIVSSGVVSLRQLLKFIIAIGMRWLGEIVQVGGLDSAGGAGNGDRDLGASEGVAPGRYVHKWTISRYCIDPISQN